MPVSFPLAPMDRLMGGFTVFAWCLPLVFVVLGALSPTPVGYVLFASAGAMVATYLAVWAFARPMRFEVHDDALAIVFPAWTRRVPRAGITAARRYEGDAFKREIGWGMRVGVGGLWGGFGWLVTPKGRFEMYISRVTDLVVLSADGRDDLLLSPDDAARFVQAFGPR